MASELCTVSVRAVIEAWDVDGMPLSNDALHQMVSQNHEMAEEGHGRLRGDYRDLARRVGLLETSHIDSALHIAKMESTPTEVTELRFTPTIVLSIVTVCLTIAGGMWASTYGLRSDVRDILTHMSAQVDLEKSNTKLQDERAIVLTKTIDTIDKKQELQRLKLEALTETVLKLQR